MRLTLRLSEVKMLLCALRGGDDSQREIMLQRLEGRLVKAIERGEVRQREARMATTERGIIV